MKWEDYKQQVEGSRKYIVLPFLEAKLAGKSGNGIDIGCGLGDLTAKAQMLAPGHVVGIDSDEALLRVARTLHRGMNFVCDHADRNAVPAIGLTFDYAFSNCCLCHLTDEGIYSLFMDLFSCMREGAELIFLVPSPSWAREMYSDIQYVKSGITARPRYGGRQHFRTLEWYVDALTRCGFVPLLHEEILIPPDTRLEKRYFDNVGKPIFSAFVAKRAEKLPNAEVMTKAFEVAHDNRKLEIQLFWQRSLFFWGFVAAALVGYGAAYKELPSLAVFFAMFGLVCSVVWSAGNRGSKYWQEYWEEKVNFLQHYSTGNIFYDREPRFAKLLDIYASRRMSVSKLTMALSDYAVALWLILLVHTLLGRFYEMKKMPVGVLVTTAALLTLFYCLFFLSRSKSED